MCVCVYVFSSAHIALAIYVYLPIDVYDLCIEIHTSHIPTDILSKTKNE